MQAQPFSRGRYAGTNKTELSLDGLLLSQTFYEQNAASEWHFHEHPYIALILNGGSTEVRKTHNLECLPGQSYFYNWDDVHRNKDYQQGSRNFNIEFQRSWLAEIPIDLQKINGITRLANPELSVLLTRLLKEYTLATSNTNAKKTAEKSAKKPTKKTTEKCAPQKSAEPKDENLFIQLTALELLDRMARPEIPHKLPPWLRRVTEMLNDRWNEHITLQDLAATAGVHPVHISRYFSSYAGCPLSEYLRRLRIAKALPLLRSSRKSLTAIAYECGFADQSHFNRIFKKLTHFSPGAFRRI